jgi:hypothetical protein
MYLDMLSEREDSVLISQTSFNSSMLWILCVSIQIILQWLEINWYGQLPDVVNDTELEITRTWTRVEHCWVGRVRPLDFNWNEKEVIYILWTEYI